LKSRGPKSKGRLNRNLHWLPSSRCTSHQTYPNTKPW